MSSEVPFGPAGEVVFNRTYARPTVDGRETWYETCNRVAIGNLELVHGDCDNWEPTIWEEYRSLVRYMEKFAILPAGRHLWASGVTTMLFNCWVSHWDGPRLSDHFRFTSDRLFEGGGVGTNYSSKYLEKFGAPRRKIKVRISCDARHQDWDELAPYADTKLNDGLKVEDTREGWSRALTQLIDYAYSPETDRSLSTITFNLSGIRPSGSPLVSSGGTASGPAPLAVMLKKAAEVLNSCFANGYVSPLDAMLIDHAIAEAVVAGGTRRSARMSIVRWDDPCIFDFINCKQKTDSHWTTNISVEIDDEFLRMLGREGRGTRRGQLAEDVHRVACKAMLENGEPGYWNSSLSQLGETGTIVCTNPCGEIALEASEPCNLGHVNMDFFHDQPEDDLFEAHRLVTRFLMRATFGDVKDEGSRKILDRNRRIGVGHLGVQGYWAKNGVPYSEIPFYAPVMLKDLYREVRFEARRYAFELRIPEPVKVTDVAPTGSVAKLPGATEGIGALHSKWFEQRIRFSMRNPQEADTVLEAMEAGLRVETDQYDASGQTAIVVYPTENILVRQVRELGIDESVVQSADELTLRDMLGVQACYQQHWADNAVSYTCNISEGSVSQQELEEILSEFLPVLKGTTIMVDASRPQAPYTRITKEEFEAATTKSTADGINENCASGACPVR